MRAMERTGLLFTVMRRTGDSVRATRRSGRIAHSIRVPVAAAVLSLLACSVAAQGVWDQPASVLAGKVADTLGPGQARLTIQNLSSIPAEQIPVIRKLLAQDLKARGITLAGAESANAIRVTLSESARERLWVAEVAEGDDAKVVMLELGPAPASAAKSAGALVLRKQLILTAREPVLAVLDMGLELVALEPQQIVFYAHAADGWQEQQRTNIGAQATLARDPRGMFVWENAQSFDAWLPGAHCIGGSPAAGSSAAWSMQCHASDDPWTIETAPSIRAFYNASRNYFTGVLVPDPGPALSPFYSLAVLPRAAGSALLIGGIDGKVQAVENGALYPIDGTRDWGSDFAVLESGCGAGTQVIVSGSGDAPNDSLRAYEVPAAEAEPASEPLDIQGTVKALSTAPDQKSVLAIVRNANHQYEVDRVTALCN